MNSIAHMRKQMKANKARKARSKPEPEIRPIQELRDSIKRLKANLPQVERAEIAYAKSKGVIPFTEIRATLRITRTPSSIKREERSEVPKYAYRITKGMEPDSCDEIRSRLRNDKKAQGNAQALRLDLLAPSLAPRVRTKRRAKQKEVLLSNAIGYAHVAPTTEDINDTIVSAFHIKGGKHATKIPTREVALRVQDLEVGDEGGAVPKSVRRNWDVNQEIEPDKPVPIPRAIGLQELAAFGPRQVTTIKGYIVKWNVFVDFCDLNANKYDPWVFSAEVFELFAGYCFEGRITKSSIDGFASALNYVYRIHHLPPYFRGGRVKEIKIQYKKAAKARKKAEGKDTDRLPFSEPMGIALIKYFKGAIEKEDQQASEQAAAISILLLFWIRASSFGYSKPRDVAFLVDGDLQFVLRKSKDGGLLPTPSYKSIEKPPTTNVVATVIFDLLRTTLRRNPNFSGENLGLTYTNAADSISKWIRRILPRADFGLVKGTSVSSHSGRITGSSPASRTFVHKRSI